jgi:hypothetical protein
MKRRESVSLGRLEGVATMTNLPDRLRFPASWASRDARAPGYRRVAIGGFLLAIQGLGTAGTSILFALQGMHGAVDLFGLSSPAIVYLVELPLAILSMVGGAGLWLGRSPVVGLGATVAWVALYLGIGIAGGGFYSLILEVGLLLLILSGACARRGPAGRPRNELLHGR